MNKIIKSLRHINYRLFIALLVMGICPAIYMSVRTHFIGDLPSEWAYSIAGQLSWVNLLYEIINEAIILPLFYFIGKAINNKKEFINSVKSGLIISFSVYFLFSLIVFVFAKPLLNMMATSKEIIDASCEYIRIECIANIFGILYSFICVVLITLGKDKYVYILTFVKLVLSIIFDTFLLSSLPISLNLGVNGIAYSNIFVNLLLFVISIIILYSYGYNIFNKAKIDFKWTKDFIKIGGISGLESFVRNIAYICTSQQKVDTKSI